MGISSIHTFLSQADPFRSLPADELARLEKGARQRSYKKGETLYAEGDAADSVWVLQDGRIQIFKFTSTGHSFAIESLGPKELFGTLCRMGGNSRSYPCTAVAATPTTVIQIADQAFLQAYNHSPAMMKGVCSLCSERLNNVRDLSCQGQEPVEKRIAMTLLRLYKQHGAKIPMTKREVGELSGTTVETAIRTLSSFTKKGWVSSIRGAITLKNLDALQKEVALMRC